jgi:hypothetical protein
MPNPTELAQLAARQAELVAALVADQVCPTGFDPAQIAAQQASLLRKRWQFLCKNWPGFLELWPTVIPDEFQKYAQTTSLTEHGGGLYDGQQFAHCLAQQQLLSRAICEQLLQLQLFSVLTPVGYQSRRLWLWRTVTIALPFQHLRAIWIRGLGISYRIT